MKSEAEIVKPATLRNSREVTRMKKYYCDICGKELNKKNTMYGHILCSKHMHQMLKYGNVLDTNQRTIKDLNDYRVEGDIAIFNIYNGTTSDKIGEFMIDKEDLEKVKYHKWRFCHGHVVTGLPAKGTQRDVSWTVLGLDSREHPHKVIDHINGNSCDNRKSNLRICTQGQNVINKSFMSNNTSEFIGVSYKKDRGTYDPEIRINKIRCHLGTTKDLKEAVYKRLYAETLIFKKYQNPTEKEKKEKFTQDLTPTKRKELQAIVEQKLKDKGLWQ